MSDMTEYGELSEDQERSNGRHDLHVSHLVMGVAFCGIVLVWLLSTVGAVPDADLGLLVPLPFLFAGGLGLLGVFLASRRRS